MKRRPLTLLLVAGLMVPIVSSLTASQLYAQMGDRPEFGPGEPGDRAERLVEELDLTDTQVDQIRTIRQEARDDMQTVHQDLYTARETLHDLMAGDATEAELRAQHEIVQTLHRQVADQRFENMLAVRSVLTPEQRAELGERMEQRRQNRRGMLRGVRNQQPLNRQQCDR